jgi:lysosomal alpha-mannosidase
MVHYFKQQAKVYRTNNLLHTIGEDFTYSNARMQFKNFDKVMKYINERSNEYNMTIRYSTPSEYIKSIRQEKRQYSVKKDDFFPYSDYEHAMWTGYFTSRPAIKGFVKDFSRFAQNTRRHIS